MFLNLFVQRSSRPEICVEYFLLFTQKTSHQRSWHNKNPCNFEKLQVWDAKNDQNTNFTNCQVPNGVFVNSTIPKLKFCKIAQLVICQFLLWEVSFWGKEKKYFPHIPRLNSLRLAPKQLSIPLNKLPGEILVHHHLYSLT